MLKNKPFETETENATIWATTLLTLLVGRQEELACKKFGLAFLVPAYPGCTGKETVKRVTVKDHPAPILILVPLYKCKD